MDLVNGYHFNKIRLHFRVWQTDAKKMIYLKFDELEKLKEEQMIMQCTGLMSKDGKFIYEGDIVEFFDELEDEDSKYIEFALVSWNDECADFELIKLDKNLEKDPLNIQSQCIRGSAEISIRGNIFEGIFSD